MPFENPPADIENDLTQGDAHGHFHQTGVIDLAGEGKDGRSGASLGADGAEPIGPVDDDLGDIGIAFHIVQIGRLAPESGDRRERGTGAGFTATAFDGGQQGGFLAADKGPGPFFDMEMETRNRCQEYCLPAGHIPLPGQWPPSAV